MRLIAVAWIVLLSLLALAVAKDANGANRPNPTLDAAATWVAGQPTTVHCETDEQTWADMVGPYGYWGSSVNGFVYPGRNIVHLNPWSCSTLLLTLENDMRESRALGKALNTFAHEAVHVQGILDEHETSCKALTYIRDLAVRFFGIEETQVYTYKTYVKRNRRWVLRSVTREVESQFLKEVVWAAQVAHNILPPPYSGECNA